MNTVAKAEPTVNWTQFGVRTLIFSLMFPLVLFLSAGRIDWWQSWVYVVTLVGFVGGGRYLLIRRYPDLYEERISALDRDDTKSWDKILAPLVGVLGPFGVAIVAGLDVRLNGLPTLSLWVILIGIVVMVGGYWFGTWATLANKFYSSGIRIQTDRGHYVVDKGPYAIVRHPSYIGALVGNFGAALALGSLWALVPALITAVALIIRTRLEDDTLQAELDGYADYTQHTRYRLFPGIW